MSHSTDPEMNAALEADAAKLEAMGQDAGAGLWDLCPDPSKACDLCGAEAGELCRNRKRDQ